MMELRDVTKTYEQGRRTVQAVRGVSLRIVGGEFVSIMGPSGSGKSTVLHLLGALDTPSSGQALFDGRDLQRLSDRERSLLRRTRIGFVFQFFNLLPTLKGGENVALPLLLAGNSRTDARKRAEASLERVGLSDRIDHFPEEMSGGEMQRVAIARALVADPEAILCDEPTGNLDSVTSEEILSLLRGLPESGRCAVVMVTHDPHSASYGDRIVHIRDGRIEKEDRIHQPVVRGQESGVRDRESEIGCQETGIGPKYGAMPPLRPLTPDS
jgi:putative ABC transport system ATP-binding protein